MSDTEDEKEEGENEEEENEEKEDDEGEENEDDEGEENEDEEGEENEDEEGEENEDDEDDKKKKKKKDKKKKGKEKEKEKDNEKFPDKKLVLSNEINLDLSNNNLNNNNSPFPFENFTNIIPERPKTILDILNEVNNEMESLSNELDKTLSFIDHKSIDREKYELQDLLNKAKELTRIIDINESKKEDKFVQSDSEDEYYNKGIQTRDNINQDYSNNNINYTNPNNLNNYNQNQFQIQRNNFPYDPNRNKDYYASLKSNISDNNNLNPNLNNINNSSFNPNFSNQNRFPLNNPINNFSTNPNLNNRFNTGRMKKMDNLYRNNPFSGRQPVIYSQSGNQNNLNVPLSQQPLRNINNIDNNNNYFNQNNPKPFERFKPRNISQAMDILLDKQ